MRALGNLADKLGSNCIWMNKALPEQFPCSHIYPFAGSITMQHSIVFFASPVVYCSRYISFLLSFIAFCSTVFSNDRKKLQYSKGLPSNMERSGLGNANPCLIVEPSSSSTSSTMVKSLSTESVGESSLSCLTAGYVNSFAQGFRLELVKSLSPCLT